MVGGLCIPVGLVAGPFLLPAQLLAVAGIVLLAVALSYRAGTRWFSRWSMAVAITGVAGPGGGTPMKPVGTVHFATARSNHGIHHQMERFELADREGVQLASVAVALQMLRDAL